MPEIRRRMKQMYLFNAILIALFLFSGIAYAKDDAREAERLIDAGQPEKAENVLNKLISNDPKNAMNHQLLGDAYRKEGRLDDALAEYEKAKSLGGENAELDKKIASTYKRKKEYRKAESSYRRALELSPKDEEAKEDLRALELNKGLRLTGSIGGWEADNTKEKYEVVASYGGFDKLDLNAGYNYSDQIYYTRHRFFANGYYFYGPNSYFKPSVSYKDYNYPVDPVVQKPNPDSNSYDKVPSVEFEVSHWFNQKWRGTLAYEYFRPSFFYDTAAHANNHKVSSELYYVTPLEYLRLKVMYAILRDPDPDKTEIKGRDNSNTPLGVATSTSVSYRTQSLLGAGAEILKDKWNAELKYLPNRDLDSSYSWSIITGVGYSFTDRIGGRLDYVHDKYSSKSNYSGKTANVYLASVFYKLNPSVDLGVGYKFIDLPTTNENTGFVSVTYRTGLGI